MIDQIVTLLGISHNYEIFAIIIAAAIVLLFMFEFLFIVSTIMKKIGGFR